LGKALTCTDHDSEVLFKEKGSAMLGCSGCVGCAWGGLATVLFEYSFLSYCIPILPLDLKLKALQLFRNTWLMVFKRFTVYKV
jgi:hypothetical protein